MKETFFFPVVLLLCLVVASCCRTEKKPQLMQRNSYTSVADTLYPPFDTARVLRLYDIKTQVNALTTFKHEARPELESGIDTIEVTYMNFACDCPNWHDLALAPENPTSDMSPDYAYYIEPASKELVLTDLIRQCTVRLIGRHYKNQGLPKDTEFTDPHPPAGNVFRYYAYEMALPVVIWGPYYHTGKREIPSDPEELIMATQLTIKK
jgi:hypothetical protein